MDNGEVFDEWQSVSTILGEQEEPPAEENQEINDPYFQRMDTLIRLVGELTKSLDQLDRRLAAVERRQFRVSVREQPRVSPLLWGLMGIGRRGHYC